MTGSERYRKPLLGATLLVVGLVPAFGAEPEGATMQALRDELARSMAELRMDGMPRPYFIAYTVVDADTLTTGASFGASLPTSEARSRRLQVELRVGEPAFDNTNFRDRSFLPARALTRTLPLADDYQEVRRQTWLATDAAYKQALEMLAKKRAVLQNETRSEEVGDFHAQEPSSHFEDADTTPLPVAELEDLVRDVSSVFVDMPDVHNSTVNATLGNHRVYYVNSEGTAFTRSDPHASVWVQAQTQAEDGAVVRDFAAAHGQRWEEIDRDHLVAAAREIGETVAVRRAASDLARYTGPVLVTGQAAAELFAQVFMPRLLAKRAPDMDPQFRRFAAAGRNPFIDKLGGRVLPRLLDVVDDPTIVTPESEKRLVLEPVETVEEPANPRIRRRNTRNKAEIRLGRYNGLWGFALSIDYLDAYHGYGLFMKFCEPYPSRWDALAAARLKVREYVEGIDRRSGRTAPPSDGQLDLFDAGPA